jgi:hypothetical protein
MRQFDPGIAAQILELIAEQGLGLNPSSPIRPAVWQFSQSK